MGKHSVDILIRGRDLASQPIRSAKRSLEGLGSSAKSVLGTLGVTLGAAGILAGIKKVVSAASQAEEIGNKFRAVFKEESDAAKQFGDNLAKSVGRSKVEIQDYLATLQDTFVPLGFARDEARGLSQTMVQLAIDLGSFNNKADGDVIRDLQSAMVGNHETMRKYGVIITQATLDQELLNMGFAGGAIKATEQMKAQARLNLIMKGTSDAQGDAARTADSFANKWKALKAEFSDASVELGKILIPYMTDLVDLIREGIGVLSDWGTTWEIVTTTAALQMVKLYETVKGGMSDIGDILTIGKEAITGGQGLMHAIALYVGKDSAGKSELQKALEQQLADIESRAIKNALERENRNLFAGANASAAGNPFAGSVAAAEGMISGAGLAGTIPSLTARESRFLTYSTSSKIDPNEATRRNTETANRIAAAQLAEAKRTNERLAALAEEKTEVVEI